MIFFWVAVLAATPVEDHSIARTLIANAALRLVGNDDPAWHPEQRDCAGLVRYAYHRAFEQLAPERVRRGLWLVAGVPSSFADAQTLLRDNFVKVKEPLSGDLAAFSPAPEVFHLMLVAKQHARTWVVYATGNDRRDVRAGSLAQLRAEAPAEWQPVQSNPAFLGFYRWKEWMGSEK